MAVPTDTDGGWSRWTGTDLKVGRAWPLAGTRVSKEGGQWGGPSVWQGAGDGPWVCSEGRGPKAGVREGRVSEVPTGPQLHRAQVAGCSRIQAFLESLHMSEGQAGTWEWRTSYALSGGTPGREMGSLGFPGTLTQTQACSLHLGVTRRLWLALGGLRGSMSYGEEGQDGLG